MLENEVPRKLLTRSENQESDESPKSISRPFNLLFPVNTVA